MTDENGLFERYGSTVVTMGGDPRVLAQPCANGGRHFETCTKSKQSAATVWSWQILLQKSVEVGHEQ
jgi:hypothetical protein